MSFDVPFSPCPQKFVCQDQQLTSGFESTGKWLGFGLVGPASLRLVRGRARVRVTVGYSSNESRSDATVVRPLVSVPAVVSVAPMAGAVALARPHTPPGA